MASVPLPPPARPPPPVDAPDAILLVGDDQSNLDIGAEVLLSEPGSLACIEVGSPISSQSLEIKQVCSQSLEIKQAWGQDEKKPSWLPPDELTRVSNDDLQEAAVRGDLGLVRRVIHAGASVNAPLVLESQDELVTLLHVLAIRPEVPNGTRIIGEIMRQNADINARSSSGLTPLMFACKFKNLGAVEALIDAQVDVLPEDDYGRNALGYAINMTHGETNEDGASNPAAEDLCIELTKLLCQAGTNCDNGGCGIASPIVESVKQESQKMVDTLLMLGAAADGLPEASSLRAIGMVKILIDALANPFVKDDDGMTAMEIAKMNGDTEIERLLKRHIRHLKEVNHPHLQTMPDDSDRVHRTCST
jgi:ankyrin repeat protein